MLTKQNYLRVREQLSFERDLRMVVLTVGVNQALFALGLWLLHQPGWVAYWFAQLIFPVVFFQAFSLLHDCGHGSCLRKSWANAVLGHLASVLCLMPYFPWKYQHALHHVWTGNVDKDPTMKALKRFRETGRVPMLLRVAWRSWVPLMALMQHVVFWSYPIDVWRQRARWQLLPCLFSVAWLAFAYTALHWLAPATFNLKNFAPAVIIYLFVVELVNLPHHSDRPLSDRKLALWEQAYTARSCYYPIVVSELLVLNFNFHIEHHLFPSLPWYRLRGAHKLVKAELEGGYEQAVGIGWNLANRSKDVQNVLRTYE